MAFRVSTNLDKCKIKNQKEQQLLQRQLTDISRCQKGIVHQLGKEKLNLFHELQSYRSRALRSSLTENLIFHDRLTLMRRDLLSPRKEKTSLFDRSKGFSKVRIDDDDGVDAGMTVYSRRFHADENVHVEIVNPTFYITEKDIYVHYPCAEIERYGKSVVSLAELKEIKEKPFLPDVGAKRNRPYTVSGSTRSRYPKPQCVSKLQRLSGVKFDQYTDGTMHLEERKFQQRQKEFFPTKPGHLPTRRRYSDDENRLQLVLDNPAYAGHLPANNVKVYIPKSLKDERATVEKQDLNRFLRLKQERQATEYAAVLDSTSGFIGKETHFKDMVKHPHLSNEERKLLMNLIANQDSTYKSASIAVDWNRSSTNVTNANRSAHGGLESREKSVCDSIKS